MSSIQRYKIESLFQHRSLGEHCFRRINSEGRVELTCPQGGLFRVADADGFLELPTEAQFRDLIATRQFTYKSAPLPDAVRARARRAQLSAAEVRARKTDKAAPFRREVLTRYDREQPNLGDKSLEDWRNACWNEAQIREEFGCWPAGSTIRSWVKRRGSVGDRRWSDTTSERGKGRKRRTNPSSLAVATWHALDFYTHPGRTVWALYTLYCTDLRRLCRGELMSFPRGAIPVPSMPVEPMHYETFRRLVLSLASPGATEIKLSGRGRRKRWGGGGTSTEVTAVFELVAGDDTPFPNYYLIDGDRNIAAGEPTVMINVDMKTNLVVGWHVDCGPPSQTTLMRTILHTASPKVVPERFRKSHPELADAFGKVGCYLYDNALQNVARAVEDAAGDTCSEVSWAGDDEPTHKSKVERILGTLQSMLSKELQGHQLDIRTVRELGLKASNQAVVTIETFKILLDEAIATYNILAPKGGISPLQAFLEESEKHGIEAVADLDEFEKSIGSVQFDVTLSRNGLQLTDIKGLHFSDYELTPILLAEELSLGARHGKQKDKVKVKVKYLPDDLSKVFMWSQKREQYVTLPCTRKNYAKGLTLWLHNRIRDFASERRLAFSSEAEQLEARAGLIELVRTITPEASEVEKRLKARVLSLASNRSVVGDVIDLLPTPASPSGRETVIEHDLGAVDRRDRYVEPPRRRRGTEENALDETDKAFQDFILATDDARTSVAPTVKHEPPSPTGREKAQTGKKRQSGKNSPNSDLHPTTAAQDGPAHTARNLGAEAPNSSEWSHYE